MKDKMLECHYRYLDIAAKYDNLYEQYTQAAHVSHLNPLHRGGVMILKFPHHFFITHLLIKVMVKHIPAGLYL